MHLNIQDFKYQSLRIRILTLRYRYCSTILTDTTAISLILILRFKTLLIVEHFQFTTERFCRRIYDTENIILSE